MVSIKLILFISVLISVNAADSNEDAVRECGNLHHLEFRNLPNARGEYSNFNCMLKCEVGDRVLSNDAINDGFPCPADPNGICRQGQCQLTTTGAQTEAQRECGNLHHIDFHNTHSTGTTYTESQCSLKCVLNGAVVSDNHVNEGYSCPLDSSKICRSGKCIADGQSPNTVPTVAPTTAKPTLAPTTAKPSIFANYKIHDLQLVVEQLHLVERHAVFQVETCLQDHTNIVTSTNCVNSCQTGQLSFSPVTNIPLILLKCNLTGPFTNTDMDTLVITAHYITPQNSKVLIGSTTFDVKTLLEYGFTQAVNHTENESVLRFEFHHQYDLYGPTGNKLDMGFNVHLQNRI